MDGAFATKCRHARDDALHVNLGTTGLSHTHDLTTWKRLSNELLLRGVNDFNVRRLDSICHVGAETRIFRLKFGSLLRQILDLALQLGDVNHGLVQVCTQTAALLISWDRSIALNVPERDLVIRKAGFSIEGHFERAFNVYHSLRMLYYLILKSIFFNITIIRSNHGVLLYLQTVYAPCSLC